MQQIHATDKLRTNRSSVSKFKYKIQMLIKTIWLRVIFKFTPSTEILYAIMINRFTQQNFKQLKAKNLIPF